MKFREKRERKVRPDVDLTPLIDVVFQLLIFFMLSATFVVQSSISIEMPTAEGATQLDQKMLSVTLAYGDGGPDGSGAIYVDNIQIPTFEELSSILAEHAVNNPGITLQIRADSRRPTGSLIRVMGIANTVGITKYEVGARPPEETQ